MTRFRRGNNVPDNSTGDKGTDKYAGGLPEEDRKPWPPHGGSHGGFACVTLYKERQLDLRRADHKFLHEWRKGIIEDLGGPKEINGFQTTMVDQAVSLMIILSKMSEYVEANGIMGKDGQLTACLRGSFLQYTNTLRHSLLAAYEMGNKKPKTPNLRDYLEKTYDEKEEDNDGKNERTERTRTNDP